MIGLGEILNMGYQKYLWSVGTLSVALCVELVSVSLVTPPLRAQSLEVSVTFPPTEQRGAPSRTIGAGQRGSTRSAEARRPSPQACLTGNNPALTALTPEDNVATTVSANPTLYWYVPETKAKSAKLTVLDEQNKNVVYQTSLTLKGIPGVVKVNLPKSVSLETGKNYQWKFLLICNPETPRDNLLLQGGIKRNELSSEQKTKLSQVQDPLKQAEVYAEAKIWQETLAILSQLHQERPHDSKVTDAWEELLDSVKLSAIATEPLVECCTAETSDQ